MFSHQKLNTETEIIENYNEMKLSVPFQGNFELHPLGVAMGECLVVTRV